MRRFGVIRTFLLILTCFAGFSLCAWAQPPDFEEVDYSPDRFLTREPEVVGFDGPRAILEFETVMPAPGARV